MKTKIIRAIILILFIAQPLLAKDINLNSKVNTYVQSLRKQNKVSSNESTSWYAWDITSGKEILSINAKKPMQAASMIKPFVALAFFHRVKKGEIIYGQKSKQQLEKSIQHSNNKSTNWLMRNAGGPALVNKILTQNYPSIFKQTKVVEYIPAGGKTYRNVASANDYGRFLKALWAKKLPHSNEILRVMGLPGRDRLYSSTPIPKGTMVYNKTGSTARLCGDMGILVAKSVNGKKYPYIIVGIVQKSVRSKSYKNWMKTRGNVIRAVSTKVYNALKAKYNLQ